MRDDYTHITVLTDRSGSMGIIKDDAEGAVNEFVKDQKKVEGDCTFHLWDFDAPGFGSPSEQNWLNDVYQGPISKAPTYKLEPRGNTALLDAAANTIRDTGRFLDSMPEDERPAKVIFVIQTDGQENSSRETTWEALAETIKTQQEKFNWEFVFLGMGLDTFKQGQRLGIKNVTQSAADGVAYGSTYSVLSANTTAMRSGTADSMKAMNMTVDAQGKAWDADGNEIDPKTGTKITS